jgi:KDO2-lipid IV(A) lauroyltransferase
MYHVVFGFLYLLSLLPLRILYLISDLAWLIVYKVMKYRKEVVMQNLTIAFPQKTEAEKEKIAAKFYRNFTDTFIETIKFLSADLQFFKKHFKGDFSAVNEMYKTGRSIQIHAGHNFNWELVNLAVVPELVGKTLGVYLPLKNKLFERLFRHLRSRNGITLISAGNMRNEMLPHRGTQYIIGLIADQSPPGLPWTYWVEFFGRPTAFLKGPENAARKNNLPIFFTHFTKVKRGYYQGHVELCTDDPASLPEGEVTRRYAKYLERVMSADPDMWLWSHRRWKLEWKPEYGVIK